jgi:hypothetical protein
VKRSEARQKAAEEKRQRRERMKLRREEGVTGEKKQEAAEEESQEHGAEVEEKHEKSEVPSPIHSRQGDNQWGERPQGPDYLRLALDAEMINEDVRKMEAEQQRREAGAEETQREGAEES